MTDTWKFTLPEDKTCYDDLVEYGPTDTDCSGTAIAATALTVPAAAKVDTFVLPKTGDTEGWKLTACTETKFSYKAGATDAVDAATAVDLTYGDKLVDNKVTCLQVGATATAHVTFTLKGMAKEEKKEETSGAMSLASAVAAGALAVAATQF